jgi:hypothetical protein
VYSIQIPYTYHTIWGEKKFKRGLKKERNFKEKRRKREDEEKIEAKRVK